jgi:hypothetical protein
MTPSDAANWTAMNRETLPWGCSAGVRIRYTEEAAAAPPRAATRSSGTHKPKVGHVKDD